MQYINRLSALDTEIVYVLGNEGIVSADSMLNYNDITEIKLTFKPTRYYSGIYRCVVKSQDKKLVLSNRKYVKLGTFEYQSEAYVNFVRLLHEKIGPNVDLISGMSPIRFWIETLLTVIFFMTLLTVLFLFGSWIIAGIFLVLIVTRLFPYYMRNLPRSYSTDHIPVYSLPK